MITVDDLKRICPFASRKRLELFVDPLNAAMALYGISDNGAREAMFLAQIAHESGSFNYVEEIASGAAYDTGRLAERLGNTPEADGDGQRYKGRGLIQITGTDNYRACGEALGLDLLANPELLEMPEYAAQSAAWFWYSHECNELADKGDFLAVTKKINGGTNGWQDRLAYYGRAQQVFA